MWDALKRKGVSEMLLSSSFRGRSTVYQNCFISRKCILDNKQIDVITFYKYLGLYFSPKSSWGKTHDMLSFQATKAITYILQIRRQFGYLELKDLFNILI